MKRKALLTYLMLALVALALSDPKSDAFNAEASATTTTSTEQLVSVPLFRLRNSGGQYLYTIDPNELAALQKLTDQWSYEGVSCYVLPKKIPGALEMYRLRKSGGYGGRTILKLDSKSFDYFFYTADKKEADNAVNNLGWRLEGVAFYVSQKNISGTVPLNHYYEAERREHLGDPGILGYTAENPEVHWYTTDNPSSSSYLSSHFANVQGYVWQQAVPFDAATGLAAPKANSNVIKYTPGPALNVPNELFSRGCSQTAGNKQITCPTVEGWELCNYYKKKGDLNVTFCTTTADQFAFANIENDLTARGCTRFLGRAGEYMCQTLNGAQACDTYMKKKDGLVTKCLSVKQAEMNRDLAKHGCGNFLGRDDDFLCKTDEGVKACELYRIDGRVKTCRRAKP